MAVHWLSDIATDDTRRYGHKATALATADQAGVTVPRGFVIPAQLFESVIQDAGLEQDIQRRLRRLDRSDSGAVSAAANEITSMVLDLELSDDVREEILDAYEHINMSEEVRNAGGQARDLVGGQRETEFVAVRASPTGSRLPGAHSTEININGKETLLRAVKQAWASLYSAEALGLEEHVGDIHSMAVVVQRMVNSDAAAAVLTGNQRSGDLLVEAVPGFGTTIADGSATPDLYHIDRDGTVQQREIPHKDWKMTRDPTSGKTMKQRIAASDRDSAVLDDTQLKKVAETVGKLEHRWDRPLQIEVGIERNRVHVLDIQPVTVSQPSDGDQQGEPLLRGRGAASGSASGSSTLLYSDSDLDTVEQGSVLTAVDAAERYAPLLPRINGFVADSGGIASNLSLLARELGVPGIVGTGNGTDMLTSGEHITVDGDRGIDTEGSDSPDRQVQEHGRKQPRRRTAEPPSGPEDGSHLTATNVKTMTADASVAADGAVLPDYTDRDRTDRLAEQHHPETVWARTDGGRYGPDNVRQLVDSRGDVAGNGVLLSSFGDVMRAPDLAERGAAFIGIDAAALQEESDLAAVRNGIDHVVAADGDCETAVLLDTPDADLIRHAVEAGVDSIAAPADVLPRVQRLVARSERRMLLDAVRALRDQR